jgi:hypothetical protein
MLLGFETDIGTKWEAKHLWKHGMLLDITFLDYDSPGGRFYRTPTVLWHSGYAYQIPNPTDDYLEWKYGPDWRTPKHQGEYKHQHG